MRAKSVHINKNTMHSLYTRQKTTHRITIRIYNYASLWIALSKAKARESQDSIRYLDRVVRFRDREKEV